MHFLTFDFLSDSECGGYEDCNSDRVITKDLHGHHHHDHHHHHQHHDDSPEHRDCPKLCPLIFRPVCGSDGRFERRDFSNGIQGDQEACS